MSLLLTGAAVLAVLIGVAHSVLGERFILVPLLQRPKRLPRILGGTEFTARTLRFAWHLTTVAWWGFAAILVLLAADALSFRSVAWVLAVTFLVTCAIAGVTSRGRHLSWIVFLLIGIASLVAAVTGS